MNPEDIRNQLKKLQVFGDGRSVYRWEPVKDGDLPYVIVVSKTDLLLWGHELIRAIVDSQAAGQVEKVTGADRVVVEWMDGTVEVISDDETKVFPPGGGWGEYWNLLDEWPKEIDSQGAR